LDLVCLTKSLSVSLCISGISVTVSISLSGYLSVSLTPDSDIDHAGSVVSLKTLLKGV